MYVFYIIYYYIYLYIYPDIHIFTWICMVLKNIKNTDDILILKKYIICTSYIIYGDVKQIHYCHCFLLFVDILTTILFVDSKISLNVSVFFANFDSFFDIFVNISALTNSPYKTCSRAK